jgi:hypothetical protein
MPIDSDSEDERQAKAFISYYRAASALCFKKKEEASCYKIRTTRTIGE